MQNVPSRATGEAMPQKRKLSDPIDQLGSSLHDALTMARISSFLVEHIVDSPMEIGDGMFHLVIPQHGDMLIWAAYRAESLLESVREELEALETAQRDLRRAS